MASQITGVSIVYSTVYSGRSKKTSKPRRWPKCGEFTGHRRSPLTTGQWRGKYFHLMSSSYDYYWGNYPQCQWSDPKGYGHKRPEQIHIGIVVMTCCLFGANTLSESMLSYCQLEIEEQNWVKFKKIWMFYSFKKIKLVSAKCRPYYSSLNMLHIERVGSQGTNCIITNKSA